MIRVKQCLNILLIGLGIICVSCTMPPPAFLKSNLGNNSFNKSNDIMGSGKGVSLSYFPSIQYESNSYNRGGFGDDLCQEHVDIDWTCKTETTMPYSASMFLYVENYGEEIDVDFGVYSTYLVIPNGVFLQVNPGSFYLTGFGGLSNFGGVAGKSFFESSVDISFGYQRITTEYMSQQEPPGIINTNTAKVMTNYFSIYASYDLNTFLKLDGHNIKIVSETMFNDEDIFPGVAIVIEGF